MGILCNPWTWAGLYLLVPILHNNHNRMRKHKVWCHNRICKLILGVKVHQPLYIFVLRYMFGFIATVIISTSHCIETSVSPPSIHHARHQHRHPCMLNVNTSTECCQCSTLALCPVQCCISCQEQLIAEQNVCFSPAAAAAHHINSISLGEKHRDLQMCYRVLLGMTA